MKVLYLDEIAQLRWDDEDVGSEGELAILLKPFIVHVDLLSRRVQRVIAATRRGLSRTSYEISTTATVCFPLTSSESTCAS